MKQIILIFALIMVYYCQIVAQDTTVNQHFKLINQYNSIDDVYLKHPELRPKGNRIVINENEILFYNDNKSVTKKMFRKHDIDIDTTVVFYGNEKVTGIRKVHDYAVIDNKLLTETIGLYGTNPAANQYKPLEKKVFNAGGELITNINPSQDVVVSADGRFFASFFEAETGGAPLMIYNNKGESLCQHYTSAEASFKFLSGENILQINDIWEMNLTLLDTLCQELLNLDYLEDLNIGYIATSFISPSFKNVLLTNYYIIVLLNSDNSEIWRKNEDFIQQCFFMEKGDALLVKIWDSNSEIKTNQFKVKLINLIDGVDIESIQSDEVLFLNTSFFVVKKGEKYYEYSVN